MYTIETARIPVIKLKCQPNVKGLARPTSGGGAGGEQAGGAPLGSMAVLAPVAMDITIAGCRRGGLEGKSKEWVAKVEEADEAHNGEAAREFVKGKLQALPALAPLVTKRAMGRGVEGGGIAFSESFLSLHVSIG